jgi:FAD/FMN-containing dehydrogenase
VNECFVLSSADLAALFAEEWPADYGRLKAELPAWILFYVVAGYEFFPEERVATYLDEIGTVTMRLGLAPGGSVAGLSARDIMKTVQRPSQEPYWKLPPKGSVEDVFFLTTQEKIPGLVEIVQGVAASAGYPATDLGVYVQPIVQGTSYHVEFNLFYDPANAVEAERVRTLSRAATKALLDAGAFFSRPHGESARMIMNRDGASVEMLKKLKEIFDPNNIMNPGKLCF